MKTTLTTLCLATTLALSSHAQEPEPVSSRIESVGMFKNGLCLVRRSVEIAGPGLTWTVHLHPGADTELNYEYDVLVHH